MIDNNGTWAKIEGRQWFGSNLFKSCSKTSLSKRLLILKFFYGLYRQYIIFLCIVVIQ
jgi:hypothetical protein